MHRARIAWESTATDEEFAKGRYSRAHTWAFDGGAVVAASPAPANVPAPWSDAAAVDPEEAYVAALSSCHMLTFVWLAQKAGYIVARYTDDAVGTMGKTATGAAWVARVVLAPVIEFGGARTPTAAELAALHHRAHEECFLANSVKTEIVI